MRLIGTLKDERKGLAFSFFLEQKGIAHQLELQPNHDWGSPDYGTETCKIWIYEEEQVDEAVKWYQLFLENPSDPAFKVKASAPPPPPSINIEPAVSLKEKDFVSEPLPTQVTLWEKEPMGWMTRLILIACSLLFFAAQFIKPSIQVPHDWPSLNLLSSPIEKALLYDYPYFYELIDRFIQLYGYEALENQDILPQEGRLLLQKISHTPFWQGFYNLALNKGFSSVWQETLTIPLFEKIQQGQVWRLFSPALLHGDVFHLLFNMLWLIVLGKQIEQRLRPFRYFFFILAIGIISNTVQYLMSGSNFLGFSGVLCGMLTFIWMRQKNAPWEGYQLDRLTLFFMMIFIGGMALVQAISFILEKSLQLEISPHIANMAHLTGAAMGLLLGKLNFFSWRHA